MLFYHDIGYGIFGIRILFPISRQTSLRHWNRFTKEKNWSQYSFIHLSQENIIHLFPDLLLR